MFFFFFFQAEDGIRDLTVTGVQTCALPISGGTLVASAAIVGAVAWLLWPARPEPFITKEPAFASTVPAKPEPAAPSPAAPVRATPAAATRARATPAPATPESVTRIDLDATAPTWVSLVD